MRRIPVDSTDARELRELEEEQARETAAASEAAEAARREHDQRCRRGWLGEDEQGRPRPCPTCRPHLLEQPCWTCGIPPTVCAAALDRGRGRCCVDCDHGRRARV